MPFPTAVVQWRYRPSAECPLGPDERLTPLEALKAITLWGAYQHFEGRTKGSIEVGKLADLVILDKNPLTVDPMTINQILSLIHI